MFFEFMFLVFVAMGADAIGHSTGVKQERAEWCKVLAAPDCEERGVKALTHE
jgi:hypothetical protein